MRVLVHTFNRLAARLRISLWHSVRNSKHRASLKVPLCKKNPWSSVGGAVTHEGGWGSWISGQAVSGLRHKMYFLIEGYFTQVPLLAGAKA